MGHGAAHQGHPLVVKGQMTPQGADRAGLIVARGIAAGLIFVGLAAIIAALGTLL